VGIIVFFAACASPVPEVPEPPPQAGHVNDYANVFDLASKERLESLLMELKKKSGVEFLVLTVSTTTWMSISDYAYTTVGSWGLDATNRSPAGALLLVMAVKDGRWFTAVSPSLQNDLPNDVGKELASGSLDRIGEQYEHAEGIEKFVNLIIDRLERIRSFSMSRNK
jgi:uncharacterized membrane protein YgcG